MRRSIKVGAATASLALLLAACGSDGATDGASSEAPVTGGNLLIWADRFTGPPMQESCKAFADANGVKCDVVITEQAREQVVQGNQSGDVPDLFSGAHDWLGELTSNGVVSPVDLGANSANFSAASLAGANFNGQNFGVPFAVENVALYTNTDLAPECPATLDDAVENGLAQVKAKKATLAFGMHIGDTGDPYHWYPLFTADGGYIFGKNADGSYNPEDLGIGGPGGIAAAERLGQLADEGAVKASATADITQEAFLGGKLAYWISGPWNLPTATEKLGAKLKICPVPNWATPGVAGAVATPFTGTQMVFLTSKAKNASIARVFLNDYVMTTAWMDAMYEQNPRPPAWNESAAKAADDPLMKGFMDYGQQGTPMPAIPAMASVWGDLGLAEFRIASGADPEATITAAATSIATAIAAG